MKTLSAILGFIATLSISASAAWAQSDDAVIVLGAGGVQTVSAFDVLRDPEPRATSLGTRQILPDSVGLATVSDIKVLPDGSYLLADVGGRAVVVTDPQGEELRYVLDPMQRYASVGAAAVATYFGPGEPSLILLGDSSASSVSIRSVSSGDVSWVRSVRLATSSAKIVQAIVLPENRVAVALRWPEANVSAVEIYDVDQTLDGPLRFVSAMHAESAPGDVVVPELEQVRDVMGLPGGNLLVTGRSDIVELALDGTVVNHWSTGDYPAVNGELASARLLPSGHIAFATYQPGEWVRPHANHRVHWLDPVTSELIATSEILTRAPSRVEPLRGSGGTGTFGFDGGLDDLQQGDPADIELTQLTLEPDAVRVGESLQAGATVTNTGEFPVALGALVVRGFAGPCGGDLQGDYDFATATSVAIGAEQTYSFGGEVTIDAQFGRGSWCAFVEGRDQQGVWRRYGDPVAFEIQERMQGSGSQIEVTPLPFGDEIVDDVGVDAGGDAGPVEEWVPKQGCCASAGTAGTGATPLFVVVMLLFSSLRLGRSRRR